MGLTFVPTLWAALPNSIVICLFLFFCILVILWKLSLIKFIKKKETQETLSRWISTSILFEISFYAKCYQ